LLPKLTSEHILANNLLNPSIPIDLNKKELKKYKVRAIN
jgi:hypothetical protein